MLSTGSTRPWRDPLIVSLKIDWQNRDPNWGGISAAALLLDRPLGRGGGLLHRAAENAPRPSVSHEAADQIRASWEALLGVSLPDKASSVRLFGCPFRHSGGRVGDAGGRRSAAGAAHFRLPVDEPQCSRRLFARERIEPTEPLQPAAGRRARACHTCKPGRGCRTGVSTKPRPFARRTFSQRPTSLSTSTANEPNRS